MKLYTGYYAMMKKYRQAGLVPVSIAWGTPVWYEGETLFEVAPTYQMVRQYKAGELSQEEYTRQYLDYLDTVKWSKVHKKLRQISKKHSGADLVLCCFEKPDDFCHRHILAEYLTEGGLDCEEYRIS